MHIMKIVNSMPENCSTKSGMANLLGIVADKLTNVAQVT
jgi:hypothetical protein